MLDIYVFDTNVCRMENCPLLLFKHDTLCWSIETLWKLFFPKRQNMCQTTVPFPLISFNASLLWNLPGEIIFLFQTDFVYHFNLLNKILDLRKTSCERHVCRKWWFSDKHSYDLNKKVKRTDFGLPFTFCGILKNFVRSNL